ncbi:aminoglycoside phosphotransferase [Lacticaseibacillus zeae DSM 20178 = KCTC 3804]|uniref:Aminoglycoside phosphotransferase family protein n=2 Tax=Lacticaseibacillus zeae TaxID=57037 RepID=A0A5R8LQE5_LACZE|nr:phosphotransferase [Lacticaseibacillus zeae]KRK12240.1 aminoglycoside phosphotransferase [Lacticaseibacillus zeae DSM 20178 = KCTC 3804]OLS09568.1 aminoglycoside phosphotransferase [Lacticaseibacillus casei]QVI31083.1 phosphotransferase [Lacticaseibacillus zeae]TLF39486.1 aminoglycoside phosphotransferase family protein [Lacticaseibacillus zeae]
MPDLDRIVNAYGLGQIKKVTPMTNGKSGRAWRVETDMAMVLVKTVSDVARASLEFALTQAIQEEDRDVTPAILSTTDGQQFVTVDHQVYRVQSYWEQAAMKPSLTATLACYRKIRIVLDRFEYPCSPDDSHSLDRLWKSQRVSLVQNWPGIYEQLTPMIAQLEIIDRQQETWVHGDLGRWNLLPLANEKVAIIDFGEARRGPRFLDFAALFDSFMPREKNVVKVYRDRFCDLAGIEEHDRRIFLETVQLWLAKGMLVAVEKAPEHVQDFWDQVQLVRKLK